MKKGLLSTILLSALIFGMVGCSGGQPKINKTHNQKAQLVKGSAIAYAHMKEGKQLTSISINDNTPMDETIEVVKINSNGFYPNFDISDLDRGCGDIGQPISNTDLKFCKSYYTVRTTSGAAGSALGTLIIAPLGALMGEVVYVDTKDFDTELFLSAMDANRLPYFKKKLLELYDLAYTKKTLLGKMYETYFRKYSSNISNIEFIYNIQDKSNLLPKKNLTADYRVVLNAPSKKNYDYNSFLNSFSATPENFDNKYADVVNKINHQFEIDQKEYKKYLQTAFTNYEIEGPTEKAFTYNEHISFMSTIKAPSEIKYKLGKKIKIPVTIIVESATLTNMIPKQFTLHDSNMNVNFESNSNATLSVIAENKTKSFITVKSLTSYYKNGVYNISNIDREIAPESTTLSGNSNYSLLSNEMINSSNFKGITKTKAKAIKVNYGYAIKYRLNNTNINKSMYDTKKYSLYDIFKQYL